MDEQRKKSVWPWIVATVIALPVLYVASFGPWLWLCRTGHVPESFTWVDHCFSWPILRLMVSVPEWISEPYSEYLHGWMRLAGEG